MPPPARLAHREIDRIRPHRDRVALHFGDEPGEELHLGCRDHHVALHLGIGIATIGRIEHGKVAAVAAQHLGHGFEDPGALQWRDFAPRLETCSRCRDRRIDIGRIRIGDGAEQLASRRAVYIDAPFAQRLVPVPAVIEIGFCRQDQPGLVGLGRHSLVHRASSIL